MEKQRYIDGKVDKNTFEDALELMELEHLRKLTKIYTEGSKEQLQAQKNYQKNKIPANPNDRFGLNERFGIIKPPENN